jgi:hypothetical protein
MIRGNFGVVCICMFWCIIGKSKERSMKWKGAYAGHRVLFSGCKIRRDYLWLVYLWREPPSLAKKHILTPKKEPSQDIYNGKSIHDLEFLLNIDTKGGFCTCSPAATRGTWIVKFKLLMSSSGRLLIRLSPKHWVYIFGR